MNQMKAKINNQSHYDNMLLALVPLIICATALYSTRVLLICAVGFITARMADVAVATIRKQDVDTADKSSTVAAITFCMMLPVSVPLYVVVMTVALVILVGKHAFGGKDVYPFSLAALAMCVAAVNWPDEVFKSVKPFTQVKFWSGAVESATSLTQNGGMHYISTFDLLLGNHAGAMGTSFIIVIVALAVFLIVTKRITWHIPVSFLVTCTAFAFLFPRISGISRFYSIKYEILSSAVVFYAVFMLNEPATTPKNPRAKITFGVISGILTMIFSYYGSYEIGGCFAILLVNATEGFWDRLFTGNLRYLEMSKKKIAQKKAVKASSAETVATVENSKEKHQPNRKVWTSENYKSKNTKHGSDLKKADEKLEKVGKESLDNTTTLDIISRAEDDIDQVEFSTQTIDMNEALKAFDKKRNKEGK